MLCHEQDFKKHLTELSQKKDSNCRVFQSGVLTSDTFIRTEMKLVVTHSCKYGKMKVTSKRSIYWFDRHSDRGEEGILQLLVRSLNDHNSQIRTRLEPGTPSFILHRWWGPSAWPVPMPSQSQWQETESQAACPGFQSASGTGSWFWKCWYQLLDYGAGSKMESCCLMDTGSFGLGSWGIFRKWFSSSAFLL